MVDIEQATQGELIARLAAVAKLTEQLMAKSAPFADPIAAQYDFAAKYGQLRSDLTCRYCKYGQHYDCAFHNPSYPRCCCPVRLDLGPS